ncbi:hypothetical protein BD408DRAFT_196958 [Parasitella parasitica]|nr:hypothetical protein BD408DRAFT_196958 [Parasitella parasitica]
MNDLPVEIQYLVFSYLPRSDLFQCQESCKCWYWPAQKYAYKNILLKYQAQAEKYIGTISTLQELGLLAESIDLDHVFLPPFYAVSADRFEILLRLAELCPNVKYLNTNDANSGFFKSLLPAYQKGHFQLLVNIPVPKGWAVFRDYMQCVMAMRKKLTRITIGDTTNRQCYFDDIFQDDFMDEMVEKLDEFTNLKSLSLIKHTDKYIFEFDDIIEKCPQLYSFSFTTYSLKRIASIGFFNHLGDDVYTRVDLQQIRARPRIRSFKGNFLLMSTESLKYIMFKFPRLQYLEINTNSQDHQLVADIKTREDELSPEITVQFLVCLSQMKSAKFHNVYMANAIDFLAKFLNTSSFKGSVEIKYKTEDHSYISADNPMLHFDFYRSSCLGSNKISAVFERATQYEKALIREQEADSLPHLAMLRASGSYIHHLSFNTANQKAIQDFETIGGCLFNDALNYCSSLESLTMVGCSLLGYHATSTCQTRSSSAKRLSLSHCQLEKDDLTRISVSMPALEHLSLVDCAYFRGTMRTIVIDMPTTLLNTLIFTDTKNSSSISEVYLQVTTMTTGTMYFAGHNSLTLYEYQKRRLTLSETAILQLPVRQVSLVRSSCVNVPPQVAAKKCPCLH